MLNKSMTYLHTWTIFVTYQPLCYHNVKHFVSPPYWRSIKVFYDTQTRGARRARVVQWWEHLPPTNVAWVWILTLNTICGFSLLIWNAWTCFNDYFRIPKCYVGKQITIYHDQLPLTIYKFLDPNSLSGNCVHNIYFNVHNVMVSLNGRPSGEGVLVQTLVNISNRTEPAVLSNKTLK